MCDPITICYLTLLPIAFVLFFAELAVYRLPLDMRDAWKIGASIGIIVSFIFSLFILPALIYSGLICSGAAGF